MTEFFWEDLILNFRSDSGYDFWRTFKGEFLKISTDR